MGITPMRSSYALRAPEGILGSEWGTSGTLDALYVF